MRSSLQTLIYRGGSRTAVTSKVELFVIIVNGWKPLTIITKSSTLDVAAVLDPPLIYMIYANYVFSSWKLNWSPHFVRMSCLAIKSLTKLTVKALDICAIFA